MLPLNPQRCRGEGSDPFYWMRVILVPGRALRPFRFLVLSELLLEQL